MYETLKATPQYQSLATKTQVLNRGVSEKSLHLTTRGIHSQQVGKNAELLAKVYGLSEIECQKAFVIGNLHDIGHTPIGHAGEVAMTDFMQEKLGVSGYGAPSY